MSSCSYCCENYNYAVEGPHDCAERLLAGAHERIGELEQSVKYWRERAEQAATPAAMSDPVEVRVMLRELFGIYNNKRSVPVATRECIVARVADYLKP